MEHLADGQHVGNVILLGEGEHRLVILNIDILDAAGGHQGVEQVGLHAAKAPAVALIHHAVAVQILNGHRGKLPHLVPRPAAVLDELVQIRKLKLLGDLFVVEHHPGGIDGVGDAVDADKGFPVKGGSLVHRLVPPRLIHAHMGEFIERLHGLGGDIAAYLPNGGHDDVRHLVARENFRLQPLHRVGIRRVDHLDGAVEALFYIAHGLIDQIVEFVVALFRLEVFRRPGGNRKIVAAQIDGFEPVVRVFVEFVKGIRRGAAG